MLQQLPLIEDIPLSQPINVSQVPFRSPFRFPGGKTWLVPRVRQWLWDWEKRHGCRPAELLEPFAGGAIVGLTAAFEELVDSVRLVEIDTEIAAVWETILHENQEENAEWLGNRIVGFEPERERVQALLDSETPSVRETAFRTIVRNRVNRGGILARGAGMMKSGENGRGLRSRWYAETLKKRILAIAEKRDRIAFVHGDGPTELESYASRDDVVLFIDPPYTAGGRQAGSRLYRCWEIKHEGLFAIAARLEGEFLMTYANTQRVRNLATEYGFDTLEVAMRSTHHARMKELLISRDLDWARSTEDHGAGSSSKEKN